MRSLKSSVVYNKLLTWEIIDGSLSPDRDSGFSMTLNKNKIVCVSTSCLEITFKNSESHLGYFYSQKAPTHELS